MRDLGKITAIEGDTAQVSIQPHGGCESCALKGTCSPGESSHTLWALNPRGGDIGDEVVVELKPQTKVLGSALVFIMPLAGLFLGYFIGAGLSGSVDGGVVGAALGLAAFFGLVRLIDKAVGGRRELKPVITIVLK